MPTLHLLGTGAALSDAHRTTTMLALTGGASTLVVDCGGDVVQRLLAASISLSSLQALLLTHEHIDHIGGFPLLMEKLWLVGRRDPLPVYGPERALDQARRCFATFDTRGWVGLPDVHWRPIPPAEEALVLSDAAWEVRATPGVHSVPVVGLRVEYRSTGGVVTYSSDTRPSPLITHLAREADILVHEASGPSAGHSSPAQAATVAAEARARRLILVHVPAGLSEGDLREARSIFTHTSIGQEQGAYEF